MKVNNIARLIVDSLTCCQTQIQIQFIELVARRLKIKKLNKQ